MKPVSRAQLDGVIYDEAYAEMMRWMLVNWSDMQASEDVHPHAILAIVMIRRLKEFQPSEALTPEILGMVTWDDVVAELDVGKKGIDVVCETLFLPILGYLLKAQCCVLCLPHLRLYTKGAAS